MEKTNKVVITILIIILITILGIGSYFIYTLNNKIEQQNNSIADLKAENQRSQTTIDNMLKTNSQTLNIESTNKSTTQSTNESSNEDIIKDLFLAKLKEINNTSSEKLLDYRIDKIEILSNSQKQSFLEMGYNLSDVLANVTYSVKPQNVNTSNWVAGNGEINGEWIINKNACECLRNGKLINTTGFSTSF